MVRSAFERDLRDLQDGVLIMGSMVDRAIESSIDALRRLDRDQASKVIQDDLLINKKRFQLEETAIELIFKQIKNPELPPEKAVLPTRLVVRATTAPPHYSQQ